MNSDFIIDEKFYEINRRFLEIYETRKMYDWKVDVVPLDGTKPYLKNGYFFSSVDASIEEINNSTVSVSTLYKIFDEFLLHIKKELVKPIYFEHINVYFTDNNEYKFVVIYKTYVFGLN